MSRDVLLCRLSIALFVARIEIVAGAGRRTGHVVGPRAMRPAPPARETIAAGAALEAGAAIDLRLRSGDERRQPIDAGVRYHGLRLRRPPVGFRLGGGRGLAVCFARLL